MNETPLNIGIVGLGFGSLVAEALISGPARSLFTLAAVCDSDAVKLGDFCGRHRVKGYSSIEQLLADDTIRTIALFSGPVGRATLLRQIIRAGRDVMTTKPFELDPAAARDVLEEARSLGRTIHMNSPPPDMPGYLSQIQRWQQEYSLGRPISCRGEVLASYREKADGRWLDDPALCPAAPIFRLGIYLINDLVRLFGQVSAVQIITSRIFTERPTADNAQLGLLFENKAIGSIYASFCVENGQHYANSLTLNYERGTIYRNVLPVDFGEAGNSSRLLLIAASGKNQLVRQEWKSSEISGDYSWEAFHDAVTKRRQVAMPVEEIVSGVEVIAAMARAEISGKTESVSIAR